MLGRVNVEHKIDERPFEAGTSSVENGEARTRDLGRAFEIEYAEPLAQIDVIFWFKRERSRFSPFADLDIGRFVRTDGYVGRGNVGQVDENIPHRRFGGVTLRFQFCLLFLEARDLGLFGFGSIAFARLHQSTDLFARGVAQLVYRVRFTYDAAALSVENGKFIQRVGRKVAVGKRGPDGVDIFSYKIKVQHF